MEIESGDLMPPALWPFFLPGPMSAAEWSVRYARLG